MLFNFGKTEGVLGEALAWLSSGVGSGRLFWGFESDVKPSATASLTCEADCSSDVELDSLSLEADSACDSSAKD